MNFFKKNSIRFLFLYTFALPFVFSTTLYARGSLDDLRGLVLKSAKIPIYQKKRLQMMIFADTATRQGKAVIGNRVVIDLLKKKVDVDAIRDSWELKPYRLRAPLQQVVSFWKDRISYSDGVITSHKANIVQESRTARGESPVFFRSPILDINGIGFEADFKKRIIQINSDVRMTIRLGNSNPAKLIKNGKVTKLPTKYELARAAADSMIIHSASRQVILIGNVTITDDSSKISCDRLTVYLGKSSKDKKAKNQDKDDFGISNHGIDSFSADGNVVLTDNKEEDSKRQVLAEHLNYNLKSGIINLTGSGAALSEELSEDEQLARFVRVIDGDMKLSSTRMTVYLDTKKKGNSPNAIGGISLQGNQESLSRIVMPEEVNVQTNNNTSLVAKSGELDNKANLLYFRKDVVLNDPQMTLTCDNLVMKLSPVTNGNKSSRQLELADAVGNVKLVSKKNTANNNVKDNASVASVTTLTSKKAKLEYLNNILTFTDNVKISDAKGSLACNILTLYLKDKVETKTAKTKNTAKSNVFATGVASKGKSLDKAIALGNVFMNDGASELKTNKLTMIFDQLKPGQKGLPGMFQAGDVRLVKVYCDGNVLAKTTSSKSLMDGFGGKREKTNLTKVATPRTIKAQHAITNLVTGIQEFHKDVLVTDSQATLACQEVYIYTRPETNPAKAKKVVRKKTVIEEMDEDPFAIVSEDSIPATISLGNGMELEKIICKKDIVIEQKSNDNRNVKVFGQLGSYIVKDKKTIISGTSKKKPSIIMDGRYQECKQLVYHMEDERFEIVDGGPITKISNK